MAERTTKRRRIRFGEVLYGAMGIAEIVLAVFAFANLKNNRILFPWIFGIAAAMSMLSVISQIRHAPRGKKNWTGTIVTFAIGLALAGISAVSYVVLS